MHSSKDQGSEFRLIETYFARLTPDREDVALSIGDDCALLCPPPGKTLAVTMDTLVSGRHFYPDIAPESLGHKALAVNLSDLAAMGAEPAWVTLALTLPEVDHKWLRAFAGGFSALAERYGVSLVGGDTTAGPLSITVQAQGLVAMDQALKRSGAKPGDLIYVTGAIGAAALALIQDGCDAETMNRLHRPEPRVAQGMALAGLATSAIDISDGLLADLGHICAASHVGAKVDCAKLPMSAVVRSHVERTGDWSIPLTGGDDYELCFTLAVAERHALETLFAAHDWPLTLIGTMQQGKEIEARLPNGSIYRSTKRGFDHFAQDR